jgi:hypothetical protein
VFGGTVSQGEVKAATLCDEEGAKAALTGPAPFASGVPLETLPSENIPNGRESIIALLALRFEARLPIILATNGLQTDYGISLFVPILWSKAQGG